MKKSKIIPIQVINCEDEVEEKPEDENAKGAVIAIFNFCDKPASKPKE